MRTGILLAAALFLSACSHAIPIGDYDGVWVDERAFFPILGGDLYYCKANNDPKDPLTRAYPICYKAKID